jgi:spore coat protein U-like protein
MPWKLLVPPLLGVLFCATGTFPALAAPRAAEVSVSTSVAVFGVDFGAVYDAGPSLGHGLVVVSAPSGVTFSVALGSGVHPSGDHRNLQRVGGVEKIPYNLYQDAACSIPWGDSDSSATFPSASGVSAVGTGRGEPITIYGKLVLPELLPAGTYGDTVLVTILY